MKLKRFKDTMVAPGSNLWDLMQTDRKAAEKQYAATTEAFNKLYSKESQEYFAEKQREYFAKNKPSEASINAA